MKMVKPNYNQYKASTPANKVFWKRLICILENRCLRQVVTYDTLVGPIYCVQCDDEAWCQELSWEDLPGEPELEGQAKTVHFLM